MNSRNILLLAAARRYAATGVGAQVRRNARLSLQDIAQVTGCSITCLWRWEHGERSPRGPAALRWAEVLGELQALHNENGET